MTTATDVWVATITTIGAVLVAMIPVTVMQRRHGQQVRQINDAVNHSHANGTPRIYDIVQQIAAQVKVIEHATSGLIDWQASFDGSPFTDAEAIGRFVDEVERRFDELDSMIRSHVEWEETGKYGELEQLMRRLETALHTYHDQEQR